MNTNEKIKKLGFWVKLIFIMVHVMSGIAISTFMWGETDENGELVGLAGNVAVGALTVLVILILSMMLIFFMGLHLRSIQHISHLQERGE